MPQGSDDGSDLTEFLKKQGRYDPKWEKPAAAAAAAPAAPAAPKAAPMAPVGTSPISPTPPTTPAAPTEPHDDPILRGIKWMDRLTGGTPSPPGQPESTADEDLSYPAKFGRGIAKGGAKAGGELAHFQDWMTRHIWGDRLIDLVERHIPQAAQDVYGQTQEFAAQPTTSMVEGAGEFAGENLPYAIAPEGAVERGATGLLTRMLPQTKRVVVPGAHVAVRVPAWGAKAAKYGGKAIGGLESSAYGALGGAMQDPDDPVHGAEVGAAGGLVPGVAGAALRGPVAKYAAGHMLPAMVAAGAYTALTKLGIPHELAYVMAIPNLKWIRAPWGRRLEHLGNRIIDEFGRVVAYVPAGAAGAQTEKYLGGDNPEQ